MLDETALKKIGFTDPAVIQHILNDPTERSRYEKELSLVPTTPEGSFNLDYSKELDQAYNDLGAYYDKILKDSGDDLNTALSRLQEDYDTGKRFKEQSGQLTKESFQLAAGDLATNADIAKKTLKNTQIQRGIYNTSAFDKTDPNMGIATEEQMQLNKQLESPEKKLDLQQRSFDLGEGQDAILLDRNKQRAEEDLRKSNERNVYALGEERKQKANELASSRAQRAYARFESGLF